MYMPAPSTVGAGKTDPRAHCPLHYWGFTMKAIKGVVFDLYGTLFDVHSVAGRCSDLYPGRGLEISVLWRQKQLEYTWLRSLMGQYLSFEAATEDALVYTCNHLGLQLQAPDRAALCEAYLKLNPYPDTPPALSMLQALDLPLAILSNGSVRSIHSVVHHAGLQDRFAHLIIVDNVEVFKPHGKVYALPEKTMGLARDNMLFVSSNAWDASGAKHFGYQVAWINRVGNTYDELGARPDVQVESLETLADWVRGQDRA